MNPSLAELLGTMLLVLFGDGVVANVVLSRSKGSDWGYAWVPVIGPIIGGVVGAWIDVALWTA